MKTTTSDRRMSPAAPHRGLSRAPQIVFFALGGVTVLGPILVAYFAIGGTGTNYAGMIWMGLVLGAPMLMLGLLSHPATLERSALVRSLVFSSLAFALTAVGGIVVHNLGSAMEGEESVVAVIGFFAAILGIPLFLATALVTIPLCAAHQWLRTRHR